MEPIVSKALYSSVVLQMEIWGVRVLKNKKVIIKVKNRSEENGKPTIVSERARSARAACISSRFFA
jgi:hypothetical protein